MRKDDEITLKEAAELTTELLRRRPFLTDLEDDSDDAEQRRKREREVGSAGATLETMLSASRRGKTVRAQST